MRRLMNSLMIGAVLLSQVSPAFAWSDAGHRVVALVAWAQLDQPTRSRVLEILRQHPRFQEDFIDEAPETFSDDETLRRWQITQAATWSDLVRGGPPERRENNRPKWHYINLPIFLSQADEDALLPELSVNLDLELPAGASGSDSNLNVIQAIKLCDKRLSNPHISDSTKALYLCWLFHEVGDLHQPLHSSALFSRVQFPQGDQGGNSIRVGTDGSGSKLHGRWDSLLGGSVAFNDVQARAAALLSDPALQQLGMQAAAISSPEDWLQESHELAREAVYTDAILDAVSEAEFNRDAEIGVIALDEQYFVAAGAAAKRRVVQAGYRLAAMIERLTGSAAPVELAAAGLGAESLSAGGLAAAMESETPAAAENVAKTETTDRTAKVKFIQDLRVVPLTGPDMTITGFNIVAIALTDEPGWTNGRLIPHTPVLNPDDQFLRFDFVADAPETGSGDQYFVVAQTVVAAQGAVGVEVFASTNSLKQGESEFMGPKPTAP